jgi:hypothetical protein
MGGLNAQTAEQIQEQHDKEYGTNYAQASARSPPGVAVVAPTAAEQQYQDDNQEQHANLLPRLRYATYSDPSSRRAILRSLPPGVDQDNSLAQKRKFL